MYLLDEKCYPIKLEGPSEGLEKPGEACLGLSWSFPDKYLPVTPVCADESIEPVSYIIISR
jgi:hypothetical protein